MKQIKLLFLFFALLTLASCKPSPTDKAVKICEKYTALLKQAKTVDEFNHLQEQCGTELMSIQGDDKELSSKDSARLNKAGKDLGATIATKGTELGATPAFDGMSGATASEKK